MFKLQPNPTFKAKVEIRLPGQKKPSEIEFEFRHFSMSKWEAIASDKAVKDALIDDVVVGWSGVDEAYSPEALATLFDEFPGAVSAVFEKFVSELFGAKQKN